MSPTKSKLEPSREQLRRAAQASASDAVEALYAAARISAWEQVREAAVRNVAD